MIRAPHSPDSCTDLSRGPRTPTRPYYCPDCIGRPTPDRHARQTCACIFAPPHPRSSPFCHWTTRQSVCHPATWRRSAPRTHDRTACRQRPNEHCRNVSLSYMTLYMAKRDVQSRDTYTSYSFMCPSSEAVSSICESGEKHKLRTDIAWPSSV